MERKQRTCLKCGRWFDSASPANRICRKCSQINNKIPMSESQLQKQRGAMRHNGRIINDLPEE